MWKFRSLKPFRFPRHGQSTQSSTSNSQNVSFLDSEDCLWHEGISEEVITYPGNARNFYYYGSGRMNDDQDLSACLATLEVSPGSDINLSKVNIQQGQNALQIPFHCDASDCICTRRGDDDHHLPSPDHIRLLEILPGSKGNIECRLHWAKLSEAVNAYEALSYTWQPGPPGRPWYKLSMQDDAPAAKINCNGRTIEVGDNLFNALKRVRNSSSSRIIWADALCINQKDVVERSMQVQRMGEIFESAIRVLIWLEDPDEEQTENESKSDVSVAYRAFSAVCSIVNGWRERSSFRDEMIIATHSPYMKHSKKYTTGDILSSDSTEWQPVFKLFQSTWFHRVWVIQEAVRAKAAVIYWEDCEISWKHVGTAAAIIRNNFGRISSSTRTVRSTLHNGADGPPMRSIPSGITNCYFMYRLSKSQSFFEPLSFTFHELLKLTRQFGCKDDRDRIYGLLGLPTSDGLSSTIKPNYTKSTQQLYLEIANGILNSSSSLALLSSVQPNRMVSSADHGSIYDNRHRPIKMDREDSWELARYGNEPQEDYPSWVPQWQFIFTTSLAPPFAHPAFSPSGDKQVTRRECKDKKQLELKGIIVDTIENFKESFWFSFSRGAIQADRDMGFRFSTKLHRDDLDTLLSKSKLVGSNLEALALLLTGGKNWYGFPVDDRAAHLADYAKCLLKEGCWWSIRDDFIGSKSPNVKCDKREKPDSKRQTPKEALDVDYKDQLELTDPITEMTLKRLGQTGNADRFLDACTTACTNRWFFTSSTGLQGIGPQYIERGDLLCVFYGCTVPFVIRPAGNGKYLVVGECFVLDIMAGEVIERVSDPDSKLKEEWITLV